MTWWAELRGVLIGTGTSYPFREMPDGLGLSAARTARADRVGMDGALATGPDLLAANELVLECWVKATSQAQLGVMISNLRAAWSPSRSGVEDLAVTFHDSAAVLRGRPIGMQVKASRQETLANMARARCVFEQLDPLWYSASWSTLALSLGVSGSGGFVSPVVSPIVTTGSSGGADGTATNDGTAPAAWTATVIATTDLVDLYIIVNGVAVVTVAGTVPAGQTAVFDSAARTLTVGGYVRPWVTWGSSWAALPSGSSTVGIRASTGTATATVSWRDANW